MKVDNYIQADGHAPYRITAVLWNVFNKSDRYTVEGFKFVVEALKMNLTPKQKKMLGLWIQDVVDVCDEWLINDDCLKSSISIRSL